MPLRAIIFLHTFLLTISLFRASTLVLTRRSISQVLIICTLFSLFHLMWPFAWFKEKRKLVNIFKYKNTLINRYFCGIFMPLYTKMFLFWHLRCQMTKKCYFAQKPSKYVKNIFYVKKYNVAVYSSLFLDSIDSGLI